MPLLSEHSKTYTLTTGAGVTTHTVTIELNYNEPGGVDLLVSAKHADVTQVEYVVYFSHEGGRGNTARKRLWVSDETEGKGLTGTKALGETDSTQFVASWDKPPAAAMRIDLVFTVPESTSHTADIWVSRRDGR